MPSLTATEFIEAKRDRKAHSVGQIHDFVLGYTRGDIPDYQASAWLMAVCLNGLSDEETFALTDAMVQSGDTLDLSAIPGLKVDKHSTGGVGDKVTLAVVPILAAAGILVPKMSGRGLGFTGGTIDKLESIPGFRVALSTREMIDAVSRVGACICSQTANLVPADRKMYALRDVTGTVESLPLIAASIMSKKIAAGADAILLDVKVGRGAFMKTLPQARALAGLLVRIGEAHGRIVHATLTAMDIPLGQNVGNLIEVIEAADLLRTPAENTDPRLLEEVVHIATRGLELAQRGNERTVYQIIESGAGWRKFLDIVEAQDGDASILDTPPTAKYGGLVEARRTGYVVGIDALAIGRAAMQLGAGRARKEDTIDPLAGIKIFAKVGRKVTEKMPLAMLQSSSQCNMQQAIDLVQNAFLLADEPGDTPSLILGEVKGSQGR